MFCCISCIINNINKYNDDLGRVDSGVLCKIPFIFVSFAAFVALERPRPRVHSHVPLQVVRISGSIIALVTLELLFSSVHPHCMLFQLTSLSEGRLACEACYQGSHIC